MFAAVLANAQSAVADPVAYGLDAEGATALAARLTAAADGLTPKDVSPDVLNLGVVTITSTDRTLPAKLTLAGAEAKVTWSLGSVASAKTVAELGTFAATGRSTEKLSSGLYQRFSATVLVVPADLEYFIDSGASGAPAGSVYAAVKASVPDLLNDTSDQKWDGTAAGKTWGYSTTATTLAAGTPQDWGSSYVGADFNKPITYHLTLPAGSYSIVGVQAPRAGLTTNVYSKVKVAGTETTKSAVSTGAATPVAQTRDARRGCRGRPRVRHDRHERLQRPPRAGLRAEPAPRPRRAGRPGRRRRPARDGRRRRCAEDGGMGCRVRRAAAHRVRASSRSRAA